MGYWSVGDDDKKKWEDQDGSLPEDRPAAALPASAAMAGSSIGNAAQVARDYLTKKGMVPPAAAPEPEDDDSEDDSAPAAAPASDHQTARDYLMQKYKLASDPSGVQDAQDGQRTAGLISGLGQTAEGFARANSQAYGGQGVNHGLYQGIEQRAAQQVHQAQQARQGAMQGVLTEHQLGNQADDEDPESAKAKSFSAMIGKLYPDLGKITEGMSYAEMQKSVPSLLTAYEGGLTKKAIADGKGETAKQLAEIRAEMAREKPVAGPRPSYSVAGQDEDGNTMLLDHSTGEIKSSGQKIAKSGGKPTDDEKTYADITGKFEAARGDKAFQQAGANLLNIGNAEGLMAPYAGNLDKMPPKKAGLLADELEKIATGGAGSQSGREAIAAKTFASKWSEFKSQFSGDPSPAELGGFINDYADYLKDLKVSNQTVRDKHYKTVWNGNKNRLPPELQDRMRTEMPDYFGWDGKPAQKTADYSAHGTPHEDGTAIAAPAGSQAPSAAVHPAAGDALSWAQKNPNDPRAREILKRIGGAQAPARSDEAVDRPSATPGGI